MNDKELNTKFDSSILRIKAINTYIYFIMFNL
jgi:hypothetical protein